MTGRSRLRALGLGALGAVFLAMGLRAVRRPGVDFEVFWRTGGAFRAAADLYATPGGAYGFRYAPGVAFLFAPLSFLPFRTALAAWVALTLVLASAVALVLDREVGDRSALATPLAWLCFLQPLAHELSHGQVDVLVLALVVAAFLAEDRGHELLAGALIAGAAGLKVAPAILAIDWLVRRRWRPFAGALLAASAAIVVFVARFGVGGAIEQHVRWYATQSADLSVMLAPLGNQSVWSLVLGLGGGKTAGVLATLALLAMAASAPDPRRRLILLATVPLVTAYGWTQLFVLAIPLVAHLISTDRISARLVLVPAAAVSLLGYDVAGRQVEEWAQAHRLFALLLVAVVLVGRFAPWAPRSPEPA